MKFLNKYETRVGRFLKPFPVALLAIALTELTLIETSFAAGDSKERSSVTDTVSAVSGTGAVAAAALAVRDAREARGGTDAIPLSSVRELADSINLAFADAVKNYDSRNYQSGSDQAITDATRRIRNLTDTYGDIRQVGSLDPASGESLVKDVKTANGLSIVLKARAAFVSIWGQYSYLQNQIAGWKESGAIRNDGKIVSLDPGDIAFAFDVMTDRGKRRTQLQQLRANLDRRAADLADSFEQRKIGAGELRRNLKYGFAGDEKLHGRLAKARSAKSLGAVAVTAVAVFAGNEALAGEALPDEAALNELDGQRGESKNAITEGDGSRIQRTRPRASVKNTVRK